MNISAPKLIFITLLQAIVLDKTLFIAREAYSQPSEDQTPKEIKPVGTSPVDSEVLRTQATNLARNLNFARAIIPLNELLKQHPKDRDAWYRRAFCHKSLGNLVAESKDLNCATAGLMLVDAVDVQNSEYFRVQRDMAPLEHPIKPTNRLQKVIMLSQ